MAAESLERVSQFASMGSVVVCNHLYRAWGVQNEGKVAALRCVCEEEGEARVCKIGAPSSPGDPPDDCPVKWTWTGSVYNGAALTGVGHPQPGTLSGDENLEFAQ